MAENKRSALIPEPTQPAITYRGQKVTPGMIIRLCRSGFRMKPRSRQRILDQRAYRRREEASLIQISPKWARLNPEAASHVRAIIHERHTLEREQIARIGAVEPEYICEPLGFLKSDEEAAQAKEAYLEEWRQSPNGPPVQTMFGKGTEDGEYARVRLPAHLDMDGCPDFFDYLSERAYKALPADEKKAYQKDDSDKRKRYVRVDAEGKKQRNPKIDRGDDEKSRKAHEEAVQRYLLERVASHGRVIPALDCAPIFSRGKGRDRWELTALVERSLHYLEDLLEGEEGYGVRNMGDRKFIPLAYNADGSAMKLRNDEIGQGEQIFLYTAYLMCTDEDGRRRPVVASTIGGSASWDAASGDPGDDESVILLDLFEEFKDKDGNSVMEGHCFWSYHFGLHTEDDDPDEYGMPWAYPLMPTIRRIEANLTAISAATQVSAFTGHFYNPDGSLGETLGDEAYIDSDSNLKKPRMPRSGEIEVAVGPVVPAQQARVGEDAWRQLAQDQMALQMAVASDQPSGSSASGHAQVVSENIAKVGKRQIRESALEAVIRDGEDHLRILHAIYEKFDVKWPLQTVDELPVGDLGENRTGRKIVTYEPDWIGTNSFRLKAEYPEEQNLAQQDMEMAAADRGYGNFKRVVKSMGEKDTARARVEWLKDQMWKHPLAIEQAMLKVAQGRGDRPMADMLKQLQAENKIKAQGVPGASNGIPTSMLNRGQGQPAGPGRPNIGAMSRGGQMAAEQGADALAANATAAMTQSGPVAA